MGATGERSDPYKAFNFLVTIDETTVAAFSEVSGIETDSDVIEYRNGNEAFTKRKLPGLNKYTNITLKRGITNDHGLWAWRKQVMDGTIQRRSGSIEVLNESRETVLRYKFSEGWPSKWQGPALHAGNSEVAIETLEIACEAIELEQ